jgi:hypothetical protein
MTGVVEPVYLLVTTGVVEPVYLLFYDRCGRACIFVGYNRGGRACMFFVLYLYGEKSVLLWKYSTCCTCRRAMNSVDLFLFADMENRVFYCGNTVHAVRAVVPCIVWIYFYLLICRKECFIVEI